VIPNKISNVGVAQTCDLGGSGVLVTRPAAQAGGLCRLIEAARGRAVWFPAVAIQPIPDPAPARELLSHPWDLILFVSQNAVTHALPLLPQCRLPLQPRLGAIGAATAAVLASAGRAPDLVPTGRVDSESLLALSELGDLAGRRVLIVRGEGGRGLLGDSLTARGAQVAYAEVYRRVLPAVDPAPLVACWRRKVQLTTATSGQLLENLLILVGESGRDLLLATPLVVVSSRTAESAREYGFDRIELAEGASHRAVLAALCRIVTSEPS
jgi:uroporphyrinogen-III synthase